VRKALLLAILVGCGPVHPWERGRLLSPVMADPCDPLAAETTAHILATREAMHGASAVGGASCGCN